MSEPDERRCLSVVVPCYNERNTVKQVVERVLGSPWVADVIVVDDGSDDGSGDVLAQIDTPQVRIVRHDRNRGKGASLRTGFAIATADYVVVQDADLEYDPSDYHALLDPLEAGHADVVFGSRFISSRPHRVLYFWHSVGNRLLTLLSNMATDLNLTDMETGYKMFRRELIQSIDIEEDRFGVEPELTAKVAAAGVRVFEVGISYNGRTYADGKRSDGATGSPPLAASSDTHPLVPPCVAASIGRHASDIDPSAVRTAIRSLGHGRGRVDARLGSLWDRPADPRLPNHRVSGNHRSALRTPSAAVPVRGPDRRADR